MRGLSGWLALGLFASIPSVAFGDIIADEEAGCRSKNEGDPCTVRDEPGTCAKSTCTRNDYSDGVPPKTKQVDCLVCKPKDAAQEAEPEPAAKVDETKDAQTPKEDADAAEPKAAEAKPTKTSGCTVGGSPSAGLLWLLGLGLLCRRR